MPDVTTPMDGRSFWPLLLGRAVPWGDHILYEYYWGRNFPATPTTLALRTDLPAARDEKVSFQQLRGSDLSPIRSKKVDEADEKEVPATEIMELRFTRTKPVVVSEKGDVR